MHLRSRSLRFGAPVLLLCAGGYAAVVLVQVLPLSILRRLKLASAAITSPYLVQSWRFFAPNVDESNRATLLQIRYERDGQVHETDPIAITQILLDIDRSRRWAQPRVNYMTTLLEDRLWYPCGPLLDVYARVLSGVATGMNRQTHWGRILEVRSTVTATPIPLPVPGERVPTREQRVLDTGWLPYHDDVEALQWPQRLKVSWFALRESGGG